MEKNNEIATYQVKFVYKDGKDMNLHINPLQLKQFFEALNAKTIFWYGDATADPTSGFWTNLEDIRFLHIQAIMGVKHEEKKLTPPNGDRALSGEKGRNPDVKTPIRC